MWSACPLHTAAIPTAHPHPASPLPENIRYGKPGASLEEIQAAARASNAHAFIMGLPKG